MAYAELVKELRESLTLSQAEMAELLGVTFATVNRWENGHHEPTIKQRRAIKQLCQKNGVKIHE
ncbi:MAG: transcriptional repressor DicA [bacterium ADurb.BinA186]|nr:MAG: transcriptional repressor DicA [bacterium ADurb.BinA186]